MTRQLNGRHVLGLLVGFFLVIMSVNGAFVYFATTTFTGLDAPKAYRSGIHYNDELAKARAQDALGWTPTLRVAPSDRAVDLRLQMRDGEGMPLDGLVVTATLRRPTQAADDREVQLTPASGGTYQGRVELPANGQWDLMLRAEAPDGRAYRIDQRVWVKP